MDKQKVINVYCVLVLLIVSIFNFIDRSILSPNYNLIMAEFGITEAQMGLVSTVFTITIAICTVFFGFLNDKVNRKWLLFIGGIEYSLFSILIGYSPNYYTLLILKIFTGIGIGVILPVSYSILSDMFRNTSRGKVFSVFGIATTIGNALGVVLSGEYGTNGDWRTPFIVVGTINLLSSLFVLGIKNPKFGAKEQILEDILSKEGVEYSYRIKKQDLKYVYTRKTNFFLIINFIDNLPGGILLSWAITWIVVEHGLTKNVASDLFLIASAFSLIGGIVGGIIGDKWFRKDKRARVKIAMLAMMLEVPFLIVSVSLPFHFNPGATLADALANTLFMVSLSLFGVFFFIDSWIGPNWYSTIMDVNLPEHRGTMLSIANLVDAIGMGLGPLIGGILYQKLGSLQTVFIIASIINISGFILWIPMYKYIRKDISDVENILKFRREELKKNRK